MHIYSESQELCEKQAAGLIAEKIRSVAKAKSQVILGIPGGTSVIGVFKQLLQQEIPWKQVHIFMVDERCATIHSLDSNYRIAYQNFIEELIKSNKIIEKNVHPFMYDASNIFGSLKHYDQDHLKLGGVYDIILLSAGEDGHVASLFPNHGSVKNHASRFFYIHDAPKLPKSRMTASRTLLQKSKSAFILFFGKEKEMAWNSFNDPAKTIESCPAKLITTINDSYVFRSKESS